MWKKEEKWCIMNKFLNKYLKTDLGSFISILIVIVFSFSIALAVKGIDGNEGAEESSKSNISDIAENTAEALLFQGKYDEAILEYKKLQKDDKWPYYNVRMAEAYSLKGDIDESNRILKESLIKRYTLIDKYGKAKYKDKDDTLCNYIIFTYLMNGDINTAEECGEVLIKELNSKKLLRTMFTIYLANGKNHKAEKILNEYKVDVSSVNDLSYLASMEMTVGKWDQGLENLKKAWYIDKDNMKPYDVIGEFATYNSNELMKRISKLSEQNKDEICYKIWLAKCYSMSSETTNKAEKLLREIEKKNVSSTGIDLIKAKIYENSNRDKKAKEIYKKITRNDKNAYIAYHNESWYYLSKDNYNKALSLCKKSILSNKNYIDNYGFLMPEIMIKSGSNEICEPYFRKALYKEPYNYNIILKIADYYNKAKKDTNNAYKHYELASKIVPNISEPYYNMALINLTKGKDVNNSIKLINKCIKIEPSEGKYHRALGTAYIDAGKNSAGLLEIRKAYSLDKTDIKTLNNAGCYYISIDNNLQRGLINIEAAYKGINDSTDSETKKIITDNYNKAKEFYNKYKRNNGDVISVPKLKLFY